jgi:hypothetical protein
VPTSLKRSRVEAYFSRGSALGWWVIVTLAGLVLLLAAHQIATTVEPSDFAAQQHVESSVRLIGVVLFVIGGVISFARWKYLPNDRQIDTWSNADWASVGERAMRKLSLDADELIHEPIEFHYYSVDGDAALRRGRDNLWRTSKLAATVINSTRQQFMIYLCRIDLTTGRFSYEETHEIFYQDVMEISTVAESRTVDLTTASKEERRHARRNPDAVTNKRLLINEDERVELRLSNGSAVALASYRAAGAVSTEGDLSALAPNANAIDRLRKLVRDMRAHTADPAGAFRTQAR